MIWPFRRKEKNLKLPQVFGAPTNGAASFGPSIGSTIINYGSDKPLVEAVRKAVPIQQAALAELDAGRIDRARVLMEDALNLLTGLPTDN